MPDAHFRSLLAAIRAESPAARDARWRNQYAEQLGVAAEYPLILFGSGPLGKWVLARLRMAGVQPVAFSDNNPARWGTSVDGVPVVSPEQAVARWGQSAVFAVTIYNGSAARSQLRALGCPWVISAPLLFWRYAAQLAPDHGIDSPARIAEDLEQIERCYGLFADQASRDEFARQIRWRTFLMPEALPLPPDQGELYFPADLVTDNADEVMLDCGAFDGDGVRRFATAGVPFEHLYAFEPDRSNLDRLHSWLGTQDQSFQSKVSVLPFAVGAEDGQTTFTESHDMSSRVSQTGTVVEVRALDGFAWERKPTYIKMDIEGSEPLALQGAAKLLREEMPVLAICLYHRTEHLWQIPQLIHSLAPGYSLFLRRYAEDCWEQVCYAVPAHRLRATNATHGFVLPVHTPSAGLPAS